MYGYLYSVIVPQSVIPHDSVQISATSTITYRIVWSGIDCLLYNGDLIGYIVQISNSSTLFTINTTSAGVVISDLIAGVEYNITIAILNVVGVGPYSNTITFEAGISKK